MTWNPLLLPDLTGRVYAVTGATGGIGYFAAEQLASAGAEVILASRSPEKIAVAAEAIRGQVPEAVTGSVAFDLVSLASVGEGAEQLAELPRLDGIFLNGGPMDFSARAKTADGLPLMTGSHTVANVALIAGLLSARASAGRDRPLRIVHASTGFVQQFPIRVTDAHKKARTGIGAYVVAKTLTEIFAYELDRRAAAAGLPIISVVTRPGIGVDAKTPQRAGIRDSHVAYRRNPYTRWAQGKDAAAWAGVRALADPGVGGGESYGPRKVAGAPIRLVPSPHTKAVTPEAAQRVWSGLEDLAGMEVPMPRL